MAMDDDDDDKGEKTPTDFLEPTSMRPGTAPQSVEVSLSGINGPGTRGAGDINPDYITPGTNIRGWIVESKLGAGGMGAVYKVRDAEKSPPLFMALKISLPPKGEESDEARESREARFNREVSLVIGVKHPNLIAPTSFIRWPDPDTGHQCMLLPLVDGLELNKHFRTHRPTLRTVLRDLLIPVADALAHLHSKNIFHRDIKPANIMVDRTGRVLVLDFGIAKSPVASTLTSTEILATFEFGAPEVLGYAHAEERFAAEPEPFAYGAQADLFCLGGTFFEVLTGHLPYAHVPGVTSPGGYLSPTFQRALPGFEPMVASSYNDRIPPEVDALLLKLMARELDVRFQNGDEVIEAVKSILSALPDSDSLYDEPFTPPERVRTRAQQPTTSKRRGGSALPPPPPPITAARPPTIARPPTVFPPPAAQAPASVAQSRNAFRPPTEVARPRTFVAPVAAAAAPKDQVDGEDDRLPTAIREAQSRLKASGPGATSPKQRLVVGGLIGLVVMLAVVIATTVGQTPTPPAKPQSLLDATDEANAAQPQRALAPTLVPAPEVVPSDAVEPFDAGFALEPPVVVARSSVRKGSNADAKEIDAMLNSEFGGSRPTVNPSGVPDGAPKVKPKATKPKWLASSDDSEEEEVADTTKALGIPVGTEVAVRLTKPLDSRTIASGPAVAKLARPVVVRGAALIPSGTMVYGTATATSSGRFDAHFTRLRLPDGRELAFDGIAYDLDDKKPGIRASSRIQGTSNANSPTLAEDLARGTGNTLLGKVGGSDAVDVVKGVGQTVVNRDGRTASQGTSDALMLEAPTDFMIFVRSAL